MKSRREVREWWEEEQRKAQEKVATVRSPAAVRRWVQRAKDCATMARHHREDE